MRDNKLGIITGAAGGIGKATAERFASEGWSLILVDVDESINNLTNEMKKQPGQSMIGVAADITNVAGVAKVEAALVNAGAPLRFLGLVAGTLHHANKLERLDVAEWDRVMSINVRANVLMMKNFIPALRAAGGASIVTVSSWWGRSGHGQYSAYCASKAALISLTQSVAEELTPDIRVNSVAPGHVATPMHFSALEIEAKERGVSPEDVKNEEWAKMPLRRAADPSEIAAAIYFLSSSEASYMTGSTLDVNGGVAFF